MMLKRLVFDTNVLVSAVLYPDSNAGRTFFYGLDVALLLASKDTVVELESVLQRSKFVRYATMLEREEFYQEFLSAVEFIEVGDWTPVCRDPKDDKFLALAVAGMADFLITGDEDLLVLHPFQKVAIVTPQDFLALHAS